MARFAGEGKKEALGKLGSFGRTWSRGNGPVGHPWGCTSMFCIYYSRRIAPPLSAKEKEGGICRTIARLLRRVMRSASSSATCNNPSASISSLGCLTRVKLASTCPSPSPLIGP